ncbi:MHYT domain-containing protein [Sphingomonas sp.]|uniref:MHYT domain-containing protein n=1 Tax=Sphingomonas sp. TaxID=28214 RepID=UPI003BAC144D
MTMHGAHNGYLVVLSIAVAILASFVSLSLASRIRASRGRARQVWLAAAAATLGGGIWSMHFVGMLAFSMPGVTMGYDSGQTLLSLAIAIAFTGAGLATFNWLRVTARRIALAGLLIGSGAVAMHYLGMAAMRMPATLAYDWGWVTISVMIALGAATTAVWLAAREQRTSQMAAAAMVMGAAIAGMHYSGMRAAIFTVAHHSDHAQGVASIGQTNLAIAISLITVVVLLLLLAAAQLERIYRRTARREAKTALRLKIADLLRGQSPEEALPEVAALMGAHFGVTRTGYGDLDPVEDQFDYRACWTDGTVPALVGRFPAAAFGVKIVAALNAGTTVAIDDLSASPLSDDMRTQDTAREVDTRAILVVPFVRDGRLRTIVYLNDRQPRRWHPAEVAFMEEIAERTRLVIERAAAEAQLRELNTTLEARVEARTAELRQTQEALLQSQKMEAVGQLVSGIAHDFNNLLGAVVGAFDLIRRRADDSDRVRSYADTGLKAAERGAKLTSQLLTFARAQGIQLQPLRVCDVIQAMAELLRRTLGPMIALDLKLAAVPVPVLADPTQVEMMILNLAINARDAMPDGGTLTIATATRHIGSDTELEPGDYVEIAVSDTGIGMDEATLRRAMEPFFTTKPVGKGTGLGLAQIYGSARQAGGTVRLSSTPGIGTTVSVLLPRTNREPESVAVKTRTEAGPDARLRILFVDDDVELRGIFATALTALGHHVIEAGGGDEALDLIGRTTPDVALLDFAMPGMNGAELALALKQRMPDLPILFASGFADTEALDRAGATTVLRKPFKLDDLLPALHGAMQRQAGDVVAERQDAPIDR